MPIPWQTIYLTACLFLSCVTESALGFGSALIAMPLLALALDLKTASPLMAMVSVVLSTTVLLRNWRHVAFKGIGPLLAGAVPGIPLGMLLLKGTHQDLLKIVLALIIIGFALYRLAGPELPTVTRAWPAYLFGFCSGILGGAYNTGGPPVVIYASLKRWEPAVFRASLLAFFLASAVVINISHYRSGYWTPTVFHYFFTALPVLLAGILLGNRLHHRIQPGKFDRIVLVLLIAIGLSLLAGTLWKLLAG